MADPNAAAPANEVDLVVPFLGKIDQRTKDIAAVASTGASIATSVASIVAAVNNVGVWAWWLLAASVGVIVLVAVAYFIPRERRRRALQAVVAPPDAPVAVRMPDFPLTAWTEASATTFQRPDGIEAKVIDRIVTTQEPLLYLEGRSGVGKSSLLFAGVVPKLKMHAAGAWHVVIVRPFDDPLLQLRKALLKDLGLAESPDDERKLIETLVTGKSRVLIILDQFEEALILPDPADLVKFSELLAGLCSQPVKGLVVLISIRSDYTAEVEKLKNIILPNAATNWLVVKSFTHLAARTYLNRQNHGLSEGTIDRILREAAEIENDTQYVRPIVINMFGLVASSFAGGMPREFMRGSILKQYVRNSIRQIGTEAATRAVLQSLLTSAGTKRPRTLKEIAGDAKIEEGAARGILNQLSDFGLVRPLDETGQKWEIAHDFVAQLIANLLEPPRPTFWTQAGKLSTPIAIGLWLLAVVIASLAWGPLYQIWARSELASLGFIEAGDRTSYAYLGDGTAEHVSRGMDLLGDLSPPVKKIPVRQLQAVRDLEGFPVLPESIEEFDAPAAFRLASLAGMPNLPALRSLTLDSSKLVNLKGMASDLPKLERLSIRANSDLASLEGLTPVLPALKKIDLRDNEKLASLAGFGQAPALQNVTFDADFPSLKGFPADATQLRLIDFAPRRLLRPDSGARRTGLRTFVDLPRDLPNLEFVFGNGLVDLEGFQDFPTAPKLKAVVISDSQRIEHLRGFPDAPELITLQLTDSSLSSIEGMPQSLPRLVHLNLNSNDRLSSLKGLPAELPALRYLILYSNALTSLSGLPPSLPSLWHLDLEAETAISDWANLPNAPLKALDLSSFPDGFDLSVLTKYEGTLEYLYLRGTPLTDLAPLAAFPRLKYLDLTNGMRAAHRTLVGLKHLVELDLTGQTSFDTAALRELLPVNGGSLKCLVLDEPTGDPDLDTLSECDGKFTLPSVQDLVGETPAADERFPSPRP